MCLPDLENFTFTIPILHPIAHLSVYHFLIEKHPISPRLGAFYSNLLKVHPFYIIWALSSLITPLHGYTKFCDKAPRKAGTYITYQCENPSPSFLFTEGCNLYPHFKKFPVKIRHCKISVQFTWTLDLIKEVKKGNLLSTPFCNHTRRGFIVPADFFF